MEDALLSCDSEQVLRTSESFVPTPALNLMEATMDSGCSVVPLFRDGPYEESSNNQCGTGFFISHNGCKFLVTAKHCLCSEEEGETKVVCEIWFPMIGRAQQTALARLYQEDPSSVFWVKVTAKDGRVSHQKSIDLVLFPEKDWNFMNHQRDFPIVVLNTKCFATHEQLCKSSRCEEIAMFCYPLLWAESHPLEPFVRYGRTSWKLSSVHPEFPHFNFSSITTNSGDSGAPIFWIFYPPEPPRDVRSACRSNYQHFPPRSKFLLVGVHTDSFNDLKNHVSKDHLLAANITGFVKVHYILEVLEKWKLFDPEVDRSSGSEKE